jgi:hypothetical protein
MAGRNSQGIHVGSTSILMVFSVLCLTIFAVLSFVTTNYERKLSEKTAAAVLNFYEADSHAEEILAEMQKMLNAYTEPGLIDEFSAQFEQEDFLVSPLEDPMNFSFSFEVPIDEKQVLHISATVKNGIIMVNSWIILSTGSWSVDNRLNVWTGE